MHIQEHIKTLQKWYQISLQDFKTFSIKNAKMKFSKVAQAYLMHFSFLHLASICTLQGTRMYHGDLVNVFEFQKCQLAQTASVLLLRAYTIKTLRVHWRKNLKNRFQCCQAPDSSAPQLQLKHHCPRIALSEHEAKASFITLQAISWPWLRQSATDGILLLETGSGQST